MDRPGAREEENAMTCDHLRQWIPALEPGESIQLPCAEVGCAAGVNHPGLVIVRHHELVLGMPMRDGPPVMIDFEKIRFVREVVSDGVLGMRRRHRWVYA